MTPNSTCRTAPLLIAVIISTLLMPARAQSNKVFNVRDFGATGDGRSFDTEAIQKALDASGRAGGTVRFPPGTYYSKPITIRTKTTIQLDEGATLLASTNHADFMKEPGDWLGG